MKTTMKFDQQNSFQIFIKHYFIYYIGFFTGFLAYEYFSNKDWEGTFKSLLMLFIFTIVLFLNHKKNKLHFFQEVSI